MRTSQDKKLRVALLGCGVVGSGVLGILTKDRQYLLERTGVDFELRYVVTLDPASVRNISPVEPTTDAMATATDPNVDVVVEVIGGKGILPVIKAALKAGKRVVTANKALLAAYGQELFALARKHHTCIAFEASCAGGIPIIGALLGGLSANRVEAMVGILNGTCNTILTCMTERGWTYDQSLAEAKRLGYAEADPTLDVSGRDAAQKLAILSGLAFGCRVKEDDIALTGVDNLQPEDFQHADELGYVIKLLAIATRESGDRLSLRVQPALVHKHHMLADVAGGFNAVSVWGSSVGHVLFYGRGAGSTPTASAIVGDLVSVASGAALATFGAMRTLPDRAKRAKVMPLAKLSKRFYLRMEVQDRPGVLAQITRILARNHISVSAIQQREKASAEGVVPIIITTHVVNAGEFSKAVAQLGRLSAVGGTVRSLPIADDPKEYASRK